MTAKADAASEIKGLLDGAEDYVIKPFDMMTLMLVVYFRETRKPHTML